MEIAKLRCILFDVYIFYFFRLLWLLTFNIWWLITIGITYKVVDFLDRERAERAETAIDVANIFCNFNSVTSCIVRYVYSYLAKNIFTSCHLKIMLHVRYVHVERVAYFLDKTTFYQGFAFRCPSSILRTLESGGIFFAYISAQIYTPSTEAFKYRH